jgi:hypothetical protein
MDKQTLVNIFAQKESRRDTTNNAYANRLLALKRGYETYRKKKAEDEEVEWEGEYENFDFLKTNFNDLIHYITKVPNQRKPYNMPTKQTQMGNINPIIEYLLETDDHVMADEYSKYKKVIDDQIDKNYHYQGGLTQKQAENEIGYNELLDYADRLKKECDILNAKPGEAKTHLDEWDIDNMESLHLLVRLYLCHPSRNEYSSLRFINIMDYKKLKQPELNYVVLGQKKSFLSITNYKTSDRYGLKFTEIKDKPLIKMLKKWREKRNQMADDRLFITPKTGKQWTNENLSQLMTKYSKKLLNKSIGTTLIYKIVVKEAGLNYNEALKNEDLLKAIKFNEILETYAKSRGHSAKIQKQIYLIDNKQSNEN